MSVLAEKLKAKIEEKANSIEPIIAAEVAQWDFRQVSPNYWGLIDPAGVMFNLKFPGGEAEVKTFIRKRAIERLKLLKKID